MIIIKRLVKMWRLHAMRLFSSDRRGLQELAKTMLESAANRGHSSLLTSARNLELGQNFVDQYTLAQPETKRDVIFDIANSFKDVGPESVNEQLGHLSKSIGHLKGGVKFISDMRADILDLIHCQSCDETKTTMQSMEKCLKSLLSVWFSLGLLHLDRVTWDSPCALLEKISVYESVHRVRSWTDLKRRVGVNRRCFVLSHPAMPGEPLVVLHVALTQQIPHSIHDIISVLSDSHSEFDCTCAIFYSINATQKGLSGIDLGNHVIKNAVVQLKAELPQLPHIQHFCTLSPIPGFRDWLIGAAKHNSESLETVMHGCISAKELLDVLTTPWYKDEKLSETLRPALMASCAHYLYKEKHRGYALNTVANFHLRNGATLWRINWKGDMSGRGLGNSLGMMVNYKYVLDDNQQNTTDYTIDKTISVHPQVLQLLSSTSKI